MSDNMLCMRLRCEVYLKEHAHFCGNDVSHSAVVLTDYLTDKRNESMNKRTRVELGRMDLTRGAVIRLFASRKQTTS